VVLSDAVNITMKTYKPQCSIPAHIDGYLSSPDIRGTLDIVWTCVATLLLCTWTVLHLNVPIETTYNGPAQSICRTMYLTARKLWWMFITLMGPEIILGKALFDFLSARRTNAEILQYAHEDDVPWTLTHTFLANMGGFAIEFGDKEALVETKPRLNSHEAYLSSNKGTVPMVSSTEESIVSSKEMPIISLKDGTAPDRTAEAVECSIAPYPDCPPCTQSKPKRLSDRKAPGIITTKEGEKQTAKETGKEADEEARMLHEFYHVRMAKSRFKYGLNIWKSWPMGHPRWRLHVRNSRLAEDAAFASRSADVGVQKQTSYWCNIMALRGNVWILDARQLLTARRRGIIRSLPSVTEDEINDHSKGDAFVKAIAAFNVLWLIVQLIVRAAQSLPVTQLEIITLSFSLCSLATYIVLLRKPKDVCTRIYVPTARQPSVNDFKELGYLGPSAFWYVRAETWVPDNSVHYVDFGNIRRLRFLSRYSSLDVSMIPTLLMSIPFGAVHLIAWNFEFPTQGERLGWHIACVLTLVVPFFIMTTMMYAAGVWRKLLRSSLSRAKNVVAYQLGILLALQGIGRAFILVEALRSLTSQPGGAFTATDMGDVPHLG
jgi:hypothetical protein